MFLSILSAPIKGKRGRKITIQDSQDGMQGVDEGGPTSQFISEFCKQLGELYLMLPVETDMYIKGKEILIDISREDFELTSFLQPERGYKVRYKGRQATVTKYYKDPKNPTADLNFDDDGEDVFKVERKSFEVIEIAIALFDQQTSGFVPLRDDIFETEYGRFIKYSPKTDPEELGQKARKYYRAVGRFLLHVMADGRNTIPSTTMPMIFRNGEFVFLFSSHAYN